MVIGGGINGVGIARDAAGRGLKVILAEADDLGCATSSASSKLVHGGLRYLEQYEFRLVRESLTEREVMLKLAPHLVHPLTFIMPHNARLRPRWLLRLGLYLYDHLGGARSLERSRSRDLRTDPVGAPLKSDLTHGFSYADCAVDDARLVVATAMDAQERGATILTRTRVTAAKAKEDLWTLILNGTDQVQARAVVNVTGPWGQETDQILSVSSTARLRLVKGSHIIVPRVYDGEHAYILQAKDGRIIFVLPYGSDLNLIGTTDVPIADMSQKPEISAAEITYLCDIVAEYFDNPPRPSDVITSFAGVRPLYDDGDSKASEITRDYVLKLNTKSAPVLSVYGGKLTTYRKLSEAVLAKLAPHFPDLGPEWSDKAPLPGGDIDDFGVFHDNLRATYPWLPDDVRTRYARAYGSRIHRVIGTAKSITEMGQDFGAGLYAREVDYLCTHEWAQSPDDILWRRSKLGLKSVDRVALATYLNHSQPQPVNVRTTHVR